VDRSNNINEVPERKSHLKDLGVDRWIILKYIFMRQDVRLWVGFSWLRIGSRGELL
jgi:hypothetical protein